MCLDVKAAIPDDLADLETSRPEWLPEEVPHIGEGETGWVLSHLTSQLRREQLQREVSDDDGSDMGDLNAAEGDSRGDALAGLRQQPEFQEQVRTGSVRQMAAQAEIRAEEAIQCIKCGSGELVVLVTLEHLIPHISHLVV